MPATGRFNAQACTKMGSLEVVESSRRVGQGAGIKVYSCYEAGACGYWYHRELIKCGAVNYVVAPRPLENQRSKHQKTDRLDARALLNNLESYLRGNRDAMSIVAVPSLNRNSHARWCVTASNWCAIDAEARGRAPAPDPGNHGPRGLVASSGLEGV